MSTLREKIKAKTKAKAKIEYPAEARKEPAAPTPDKRPSKPQPVHKTAPIEPYTGTIDPHSRSTHPIGQITIRPKSRCAPILAANTDELMELIMSGMAYNKIATHFGIGQARLYDYLTTHVPEMWARAAEVRAHTLLGMAQQIADDETKDVLEYTGKDGHIVRSPNSVAVNRAKLRIELLKWSAQVANRRAFGDKVESNLNVTVTPLQEAMSRLVKQGSSIPVATGRLIEDDEDED